MKLLSLESKILAPFIGALVIFAGGAALYIKNASALIDGLNEQVQLRRVQTAAHEALKALVDAETGQRGFLITGVEAYLEPYEDGVAETERHLRTLELLSADNTEARQRLAAIQALKDVRLQKLADTIALRHGQGFEPARAAVLANNGKADMDRIRQHFDALFAAVDAREAANLERLSAARQAMWQWLWVLFGLMGLMLASAYWVIFREVRERFHLSERLRYEASHDSLTGLPNRRFFSQWLARQLAQARREQRPLALLYLDLDGFKRVNDQLGHEMGDRVLRVAAQRFRDTLREADTLARLGGDEFAILISAGASAESTGVLAARLIAALREPLLPQFGANYSVGTSIGVALYPRHGADAEALLHAADEAMYAAKRAGRNCYRLHDADTAAAAQDTAVPR